MKNFIEVTISVIGHKSNVTIYIPAIAQIHSFEDGKRCRILTIGPSENDAVTTDESYQEVLELIKKAIE